MPVVSSAIVEDSPQIDGRRWIVERHLDQTGAARFVRYLADRAINAPAGMAARALAITAALPAEEIADNLDAIAALGRFARVTLRHSTVAQNAAALRQRYRTAAELQALMIGDYLATLTDGQLQTAFGLTAGQVTTLRTNKLTPAAATAAALRLAAGE